MTRLPDLSDAEPADGDIKLEDRDRPQGA